MPNGRRRRFSVKHNMAITNPNKVQNDSKTSSSNEHKSKISSQTSVPNKCKDKLFPTGSTQPSPLDIVVECEISHTGKRDSVDKDVMATCSNIDFYNILNVANDNQDDNHTRHGANQIDTSDKKDTKNVSRRDKYPRQHRVKVRSPKRSNLIPENTTTEHDNHITESLDAIDWDLEVEETVITDLDVVMDTANEDQQVPNQNKPTTPNNPSNQSNPINQNNTINQSNPSHQNHPSDNSLDDMCRICHGGDSLSLELGQMISACGCRGTVGRVHVKCLERWLTESGKSRCELCGTRYSTRRVHKYGLPKALAIWILSQNAKQLMVDSLGIMLMSPLAVVAAWLSGRTLAGLMTPESRQTPWPLASTFVLACMTLVCYYCWIVSAVTRHALGWWIWYRSQYEVRLQLQENED